MRFFLDTNVWLRYLIKDNEDQYALSERLLELNESGKIKIATSSFVLSECIHVETSFYKIKQDDVLDDLDAITATKNLWLLQSLEFEPAKIVYEKNKRSSVKWSDCVIVSQVPPSYTLCSFDERLKHLIGKDRFLHPKDAIHI